MNQVTVKINKHIHHLRKYPRKWYNREIEDIKIRSFVLIANRKAQRIKRFIKIYHQNH